MKRMFETPTRVEFGPSRTMCVGRGDGLKLELCLRRWGLGGTPPLANLGVKCEAVDEQEGAKRMHVGRGQHPIATNWRVEVAYQLDQAD